jgi:hypothetical protein
MSKYFDQISLAAVANLTAGLVTVDGGIRELLFSLIVVRLGLKIFYRAEIKMDAEIQLFLISAVSWLVGHALLRGHSWDPSPLYLTRQSQLSPQEDNSDKIKVVCNAVLNFIRKII